MHKGQPIVILIRTTHNTTHAKISFYIRSNHRRLKLVQINSRRSGDMCTHKRQPINYQNAIGFRREQKGAFRAVQPHARHRLVRVGLQSGKLILDESTQSWKQMQHLYTHKHTYAQTYTHATHRIVCVGRQSKLIKESRLRKEHTHAQKHEKRRKKDMHICAHEKMPIKVLMHAILRRSHMHKKRFWNKER